MITRPPTPQPSKNACILYGITACVLGFLLFLLGAVIHLDVLAHWRSAFVFGDNGDGFFNMWVMHHVVGNLSRGDLNLADGRIFWPDNGRSFFWSDTLIVPSLGFALFKHLTGNLLRAFWFSSVLMCFLGFAAYMFLFAILFRIARKHAPALPQWAIMLVPIFAYLATFALARLTYFQHFQNLSVIWLFTLMGGLIGYSSLKHRCYFAVATISEVFLLYSAPYFAVVGMGVWLLWCAIVFLASPRTLLRIARDNWLSIALSIPFILGGAVAYGRSEMMTYDTSIVHGLAIRGSDLFVPSGGLVRRFWNEDLLSSFPRPSGERPAYLGLGLLMAILLILVRETPRGIAGLRRSTFARLLTGLVGGALLCRLLASHVPQVVYGPALALLSGAMVLGVSAAAQCYREESLRFTFAFLGLTAVMVYGIALGPLDMSLALAHRVNPSVWGLCRWTVPGITHMRAIGRLAVAGQGILFGLLIFYVFLFLADRQRHRLALCAVTGLLIAVQFAEQTGQKVIQRQYDVGVITPTDEEQRWFSTVSGPALILPSHPWTRNTYHMLYFCSFPRMCIMNGYSAHSTQMWDQVMQLALTYGEASEEQIRFAEAKGIRYIVLTKRFFEPNGRLKDLRIGARHIVFENDRFLVLTAAGA